MSENQSGQHTESHAPRVLEYAKVPEGPADVAADLPDGVQRRNIASWVIITALIYLCAPVLYVDFVQTTLCDKLGASKAVANLPSSAAHVMVFVPLIMTWLLPHTRWVVPVLATSYGLAAVIGAVMAVLLLTVDPVQSPGVLIAATIAYGGLCGVALPTAGVFMWEVLARGVSESRRGVTFSLCFGFGPKALRPRPLRRRLIFPAPASAICRHQRLSPSQPMGPMLPSHPRIPIRLQPCPCRARFTTSRIALG